MSRPKLKRHSYPEGIIAIYLRDLVGGGVERSMINLASSLQQKGCSVDILVESAIGDLVGKVSPSCRLISIKHLAEKTKHLTGGSLGSKGWRLHVKNKIIKLYTLISSKLREPFEKALFISGKLILAVRDWRAGPFACWIYCQYLAREDNPIHGAAITNGLAGYLRCNRPIAVITGLEAQNARLVISKLLVGSKATCILSVRNHLSSFWDLYDYTGFHEWVITNLYKHGDYVVAVSKGISEDVIENFRVPPDKVKVIYNPVTDSSIARLSRESTSDDDWLLGSVPVVLGVGRLHKQKGFDALLRSFAIVLQKIDCRLIIIGSGDEEASLFALAKQLGISSRIRLPGFKQNPYAYMSKASVFVLSSVNEGLPGVLIQAMACGCPVVSTDCPSGPREILEGGRWGQLVSVNNNVQIAQAILNAISTKRSRGEAIHRASHFSVDRACESYLSLIRRVDGSC